MVCRPRGRGDAKRSPSTISATNVSGTFMRSSYVAPDFAFTVTEKA
jgi:hypothetical protein